MHLFRKFAHSVEPHLPLGRKVDIPHAKAIMPTKQVLYCILLMTVMEASSWQENVCSFFLGQGSIFLAQNSKSKVEGKGEHMGIEHMVPLGSPFPPLVQPPASLPTQTLPSHW